jgi:ElaB/YqjD/DUF883 family membrane-anchored ribosome-binding protein
MPEFNRPGSTPVQPRRDFGQPGQGQQGQQGARGQKETGVGDVMGTVTEKAREMGEQAQQLAGQAGERVQQWASTAADRAEDTWEDVSGWVRRNPVPTLLIVAGVGLLFALAFTSARYATSSTERRW